MPTLPCWTRPTGLLALLPAALIATSAAQGTRQAATLNFGDFQSAAEWTFPAGTAKVPAVILIHGSTPFDLNSTVLNPDGTVQSAIFKSLADSFAKQGVATLRYNKHYVTGPSQADVQKYDRKADLNLFLSDAEVALRAAQHNPRVDQRRVFVYGWSEGSAVAAALAVKHPELAGLIVQGPVLLDWRALFQQQFELVQLPYLREMVGRRLKSGDLPALARGAAGRVARSIGFYLSDPARPAGQPGINPLLDLDKDGQLDLDGEVVPGFQKVLDAAFSGGGVFNIYAPGRALPSVTEQLPMLKVPLLVLQGETDASTPATNLTKLRAALKSLSLDATIKLYPGLGHSLGPASSVNTDDFQPIAAQPMQDAAAWMLTRGN